MLTLQTIQQLWTPKTCAVVFIHLYGQTTDLGSLAQWCRTRNVLLIEDVAQALGAHLPDSSAAGSVADLSVYSFNPTKILECGGGALLLRSSQLLSVCTELSDSDPLPSEIDDEQAKTLALSYRNLHHSLVALARARAKEDISGAFLKLQPAFRALYLRNIQGRPRCAGRQMPGPRLRELLQHRYENGQRYEHAFGAFRAMAPAQSVARERRLLEIFLLNDFPEKLVDFSEAVRRDGFHVSNLYWPVNTFFRPSDSCPNADQFARRIESLVDQSVGWAVGAKMRTVCSRMQSSGLPADSHWKRILHDLYGRPRAHPSLFRFTTKKLCFRLSWPGLRSFPGAGSLLYWNPQAILVDDHSSDLVSRNC